MAEETGSIDLELLRIDQQISGWADFSETGKPSGLALYLEAGGEIDEQIRQIIIDILRHGPRKNSRGGKNLPRDNRVYSIVNFIKMSLKITKTAACRKYAEQTNQEQRTVEEQYKKGREIWQAPVAAS